LIFECNSSKIRLLFKHLSKMVLKISYMRENNEILKDSLKKSRIYDDETLENMKKYYGIDDHKGLVKYLRSSGLEHNEHYNKNDAEIKSH
jgi:hypothetical protein